MTRYHLNLYNGDGRVPDEDGRDLPDLESARQEALDGIRSIVSEEARHGFVDLTGRIEITDDQGNVLTVVGYDEGVILTPPRRTL